MKNIFVVLFIMLIPCLLFSQVSQFIHVDQFGYRTNAEKVAVLSDPQVGFNSSLSYSPPATLQIRDNSSGAVIFSGPVQSWNSGNIHDQSGDRGWWFDFSSLTADGDYYVYDPQNQERSAVFAINANPYAEVMRTAGRMFYYNRCNMAKSSPFAESNWTDGNNFLNPLQDANTRYIFDPSNSSLEKDLSGGWFDAGDYNKYVTFAYSAVHDLLAAYEENPQAFSDSWNIPESGNGIADVIDEVKWELDWLLKMTNADGSVHIKMGSQNYSENISNPPSANTDPRFYGPTCTSASAAVASMFARAAGILSGIPSLTSYAQTLRTRAELCFAYTIPFYNSGNLDFACDNGEIIAGDADVDATGQLNMLITAAIYLYEQTGDDSYNQFVVSNYAQTEPIATGFWGVYSIELQEALISYARSGSGDPAVSSTILNSANTEVSNNFNDYFGWTEADLYRAFIPGWSNHWGSNKPKAGYGIMNNYFAGEGIGNASSMTRKAAEQLHYFHGVNPIGTVYLSNMYSVGAERSANEIYHSWFADGSDYDNALTSPLGPAPGFVSGGVNNNFSISSLSPPFGQPDQKSYLDFNTGFPDNSWEITEPAIYYQAAYVRLLANYVSTGVLTGIEDKPRLNQTDATISAFPNPVKDLLNLSGIAEGSEIRILNITGQTVMRIKRFSTAQPVDVSSLSAGVYLIKITTSENSKASVVRIIKL
ncbi:MAG: glycoside hydrolase family 9 protein [Calditrichia bacterium]